MDTQHEIIHHTHSDNSEWILEAALTNHRVIIISNTVEASKDLERRYFEKVNTLHWMDRVLKKRFNRNPIFMPLRSDFNNIRNIPIIFENSSFED